MKNLCVYCGSSSEVRPIYLDLSHEFGELCARRGIDIVCGGGSTGCMRALADGALGVGGKVTGVIPQDMVKNGWHHEKLSELLVVPTIHHRKRKFFEISDTLAALPGGIGTMDELFEAWTWLQQGYHSLPLGILNVNGYFDILIEFVDHMNREYFLKDAHRALPIVERDRKRLLDRLAAANRVPAAQTPKAGECALEAI